MFSFASRRPPALLAAAVAVILPFALARTASADDAGVARIGSIQGSVAVQRGDSDQPTAAALNAPVLGADYVTTGDNSRAEVDLDGYSSVRLGADAQVRFANLDPANRQIQLAQGPVDLRVFRGNDLNDQIDTPSISIRPQQPGSYRVNVLPDGTTQVVVRSGAAQILTPQGDRTVGPGTTLVASGSATSPSISTQGAVADDSFDQWDGQRDQYYQQAAPSDSYVDPAIVGVDDLQPYGRWDDDPTYGQVWVPNEPASWTPYRNGQWVWEDGYGWTWVGDEPWGWAPYHYGSWYRSMYGWAWYPPRPAAYAPVWQPAMVAFLGFNIGNVSIGIGFGSPGYDVGWVPLAPFEPYYPWYSQYGYGYGAPAYNSITYVNNVSIYRNYRYGTAVTGRQFVAGQFGHPMRYSSSTWRNARGFRGAVPMVPTAANLRYSARPVSARLRPSSTFARAQFAGRPAIARRIPFTRQRTAIASSLRHVRTATVAAHFTTPRTAAQVRSAQSREIAQRAAFAKRPAHFATVTPRTAGARTAARPAANHGTARTANHGTARTANHGTARTANHGAAPHAGSRTTAHTATSRGVAANPAWRRFGTARGTSAHASTAHVASHTRPAGTRTTAHRRREPHGRPRDDGAHRTHGARDDRAHGARDGSSYDGAHLRCGADDGAHVRRRADDRAHV